MHPGRTPAEVPAEQAPGGAEPGSLLELELLPSDPLAAYLANVSDPVDLEQLNLASPLRQQLLVGGVRLVVPLVSQGELIGLINLGPRRSEQDYSSDDKRLLRTLATQAAPALRVAQLVREQEIEARERERIDQELRVARVVQQTLLPQEVPQQDGWQIAAHWQPARAVSGDFYDFIPLPGGCLGLIVADVTDKGVPAALVMATSRSILRAAAEQFASPGQVLEHANNLLCPYMPEKMFVTCLYVLIDLESGRLRYASAGHNPPYVRSSAGVTELRARGMPLGLMPEMDYEEKEAALTPGDSLFMYSDGLVEAHDPAGEMFGYPRLRQLMAEPACGAGLIECLLGELAAFTGPGWEQEDDVTFVSLDRLLAPAAQALNARRLAVFELPSRLGQPQEAGRRVAEVLAPLNLEPRQLERLKTAVSEATMNAIEHGNQWQAHLSVGVQVFAQPEQITVEIADQGQPGELPAAPEPDLEAKLAGAQTQRGWGLFLTKNLVDELNTRYEHGQHIVELVLKR